MHERLHRVLIRSGVHELQATVFSQRPVLLDGEGRWETTLRKRCQCSEVRECRASRINVDFRNFISHSGAKSLQTHPSVPRNCSVAQPEVDARTSKRLPVFLCSVVQPGNGQCGTSNIRAAMKSGLLLQ